MSDRSSDRGAGRLSTDRDTIRQWADEHDAVPVREAEAAGESDRFRLVPEATAEETHERVEWDDFFASLDEGDHVVVYGGEEATEPFEVTHRDEIVARSDLAQDELEERLVEGEVVTSEIRETAVVETVVVEEATVESELVGTEVVDERVMDVELVSRECTSCELGGVEGVDSRDWFDEERYVASFGRGGAETRGGEAEGARTGAEGELAEDETMGAEGETIDTESAGAETGAGRPGDTFPYEPVLEVEEVWDVTRAFTERFTIESRIADTEVAETESVGDRDIDVEGLHRTIAGSDLLDVDLTTDEVLAHCDVQTEFEEGDRAYTHFDRERVVEEEFVDRKRLHADVTDVELLEMESVHSEEITTEFVDEDATLTADDSAVEGTGAETAGTATETESTATEAAGQVTLTEDEVGKTVVDATGEEVGLVTDVEESGEAVYVDAHPGITDRIKAALDWGDAGDDDYPVEAEEIERITDDRVELKGAEELEGESVER